MADHADIRVEPELETRSVSALLGCSERQVRRLADRGDLPAFRLTPSSRRKFRPADVLRLVEQAMTKAAA